MIVLGQVVLLAAFVAAGYAAFACVAGWRFEHPGLQRTGRWAGLAAVAALTLVVGLLAWALLRADFRFAYVARYSSHALAWYYALSALWVGQAGSLLVWAWMAGATAVLFRFARSGLESPLREPTFAVLMVYLAFLVSVMVFGADPMEPSLSIPGDGQGLGPLLQHPAMLAHPPAVFLSYALWSVPFALALAALVTGRLDAEWVRRARPWALAAWSVLGLGILVGAEWAYEELGWGGYWAWDPVENGSLLPWLVGTAMIHAAMAWQHRGALKKTALILTVVTFGLCNFAAFLTRSGIFGSLHEFSRSPIGWMFLALLAVLAALGVGLTWRRRGSLATDHPLAGLGTRESLVAVSTLALLLLAGAALAGTLAAPLSEIALGRTITVGLPFYNNTLIPVGLLLLATTALAPLVRWGGPPRRAQRKVLVAAAGGGVAATAAACLLGVRHPIGLAVAGLSALALAALAGALTLDSWRTGGAPLRLRLVRTLRTQQRQYAGFLMHLALISLAVGVTGSSLGTRRHEATMERGETIQWAGRSIRLADLVQRQLPDRLVVEARLEVSRDGGPPAVLLPAQHLHLPQNEWTTEVAIDSTWGGDFYTILHSGTGRERASLSFLENPMMRWMWLSGVLVGCGALLGLWPARRRRAPSPASSATGHAEVPRPHRKTTARHSMGTRG